MTPDPVTPRPPATRPARGRLVALAAVALAAVVAACTGSSLPTIPPMTPGGLPTAEPQATHPGPTYPPGCPTAQPAPLAASDTRTVTISTPKGDIVIAIKGSLSPIATGNFVALAECGWFDGVVFHRVIPGYIIQGGDGQFGRVPNVIPGLVGTGGPPYEIQDEPVTATYHRGTVAMARSSQPNSVGSQFFIVLADSAAASLTAPGYNNFQIVGEVTSGMDAADAIAAAGDGEYPTDPVEMTKVTVTTP